MRRPNRVVLSHDFTRNHSIIMSLNSKYLNRKSKRTFILEQKERIFIDFLAKIWTQLLKEYIYLNIPNSERAHLTNQITWFSGRKWFDHRCLLLDAGFLLISFTHHPPWIVILKFLQNSWKRSVKLLYDKGNVYNYLNLEYGYKIIILWFSLVRQVISHNKK